MMNWLFRKEVFISYSRVDQEFAEWLARRLSPEFAVWLDIWKIEAGKPFPDQITKGLKKSFAGLVILSPDSLKSEPVEDEWITLYRQSFRRGRLLIPIRYRDCEIPAPLKRQQMIDFRDDSNVAREESLGNLKGALRKRQLSLGTVALILLFIFLLPTVMVAIAFPSDRRTRETLRRTQREVQAVEMHLASVTESYRALQNGRRDYKDPDSGEHRLTDIWENGQLIFRDFYAGGRLIARDSFRYINGTVTEKVRTYVDDNQRVYLIDRFTQAGVLTTKRYCLAGPERECEPYVDDMSSPLPSPWLMFYR
jgi:hypothetical protein